MNSIYITEQCDRLNQEKRKRMDAEEAEIDLLLSALHCEEI